MPMAQKKHIKQPLKPVALPDFNLAFDISKPNRHIPSIMEQAKKSLIGLPREELLAAVAPLGVEPFRAKQLWHWMYVRGVTDFALMTSFSKPLREELAKHFVVQRPAITEAQKSVDGTQKWLLSMNDNQKVEMVHIPSVTRDIGALCISSQVGCTLTCRFCHTGTQRLVRNLDATEIIGQVMLARDQLGDWTAQSQDRLLNNIVFMGMGEPLYNYDQVSKAIKMLTDPDGISISKRRITLSTSGVVPMMKQCGEELGVNLAISLHATNDELRNHIMPLNRKYPIKELMEACRNYPGLSNSRRITFEYVMLKGVNDSIADAKALVKLLAGIPSKVNLIPFNAWPGSAFECSDDDTIEAFGDYLNNAGYVSPIRRPRGRDILAACGQLKSASMKLSVTERAAIAELQREKELAQGLV